MTTVSPTMGFPEIVQLALDEVGEPALGAGEVPFRDFSSPARLRETVE